MSAVMGKYTNPKFEVVKTDYGLLVGAMRRTNDPDNVYWRITQHIMPWYQMVPPFVLNSSPVEVSFITFWVPIDDHTHMSWLVVSDPLYAFSDPNRRYRFPFPETIPGTLIAKANRSNDYLIDREKQKSGKSFTGIPNVPAQDQAVTEGQGDGPIADRTKERLGTSDTAIIIARQVALHAIRDVQEGRNPPGVDAEAIRGLTAVSIVLPANVPFVEGARPLLKSE